VKIGSSNAYSAKAFEEQMQFIEEGAHDWPPMQAMLQRLIPEPESLLTGQAQRDLVRIIEKPEGVWEGRLDSDAQRFLEEIGAVRSLERMCFACAPLIRNILIKRLPQYVFPVDTKTGARIRPASS